MPYLTIPILANGPLADVIVEVGARRAATMRNAGQPIPQSVHLRALLDTGADCTFADTRHIPFLSLLPFQIVLVGDGRGSFVMAPQYEASLTVVHPSGNRRDNLVLRDHPLADRILDPTLGYEVLIGRDILDLCLFVYDGRGKTVTLAY